MFTCKIYRYNLFDTEQQIHEGSNYKKAKDTARLESFKNRGYTYRLQVNNYPFRYFENGKDVTDTFRGCLMNAVVLGSITV